MLERPVLSSIPHRTSSPIPCLSPRRPPCAGRLGSRAGQDSHWMLGSRRDRQRVEDDGAFPRCTLLLFCVASLLFEDTRTSLEALFLDSSADSLSSALPTLRSRTRTLRTDFDAQEARQGTRKPCSSPLPPRRRQLIAIARMDLSYRGECTGLPCALLLQLETPNLKPELHMYCEGLTILHALLTSFDRR